MNVATPDQLCLPLSLVARGIGMRLATDADMPFLRDLYGAGRAAEMAFVGWPAAMATRFLDDQFRLQHHHFSVHYAQAENMIVMADGAAAGRLLLDRSTRAWRVIDIALMAAVQGCGWGSALLGWIQQVAHTQGARLIELHVAFDNPRAEALYRRLGFAEVPTDSGTHRRLQWMVS